MDKDRLFYLALVCLAVLVVIFLYGQVDYAREPYATWDLASYRRMAGAAPGLASNVVQPFAYRLLGPYIIGLLPVADPVGFYWATVLASLVLVGVFFLFLCHVGLAPVVSAAAAILFALNRYLFGLTVWDFFQINDVLSLLCIVLLFWAMLDERWLIFAAVLLVGAATKETVLLMVPTVFVYLLEKKRLRTNIWRVALAMIPGLALFVLIRLLAPVAGGRGLFQAFLAYSGKLGSVEAWLRLLIIPFLPLALVPLVFFEETRSFFRRRAYALVYVFLVLASTLFGQNNDRLMAPAFVVIYWLLGVILMWLRQQNRNLFAAFVALALFMAFLTSLHHDMGRFVLPDRQLSVVLGVGALVVVTLASLAVRLAVARKAAGSGGAGGGV